MDDLEDDELGEVSLGVVLELLEDDFEGLELDLEDGLRDDFEGIDPKLRLDLGREFPILECKFDFNSLVEFEGCEIISRANSGAAGI